MKIKIIIVMLFLFCIISAKEITLQEAIEIGLQHNTELKSTQADYKSSLWQKAGALTTALPSVSFSARTSHTLQSSVPVFPGMPSYSDNGSYGINLSQPLFLGGKIITAYKMASETEKLKKIALKNKRSEIINKITSSYYNVVKQDAMLSIVKQQLTSAKKSLAIAFLKYSNGLISEAQLLQLKLNKKNKEIDLITQKVALKTALDNLNDILGGTKDYTVTKKQKINYTDFRTVIDTLSKFDTIPLKIVERCKNHNLTFLLSAKSVKLAKLSHKLSYGDFLPSLTFSYSKNWQSNWNNFDELKNADFKPSSSYGFNFSLPVFPIVNNYSNYKKSLWNYKKSLYETQTNEKKILTLLKTTYWQFITSYKRIESSKIALEYADKMYKISKEKFEKDLISSNDLLTAQISYQNAQVGYINAIYQFIDMKNNLKSMLNFDEDKKLMEFLKNTEDK